MDNQDFLASISTSHSGTRIPRIDAHHHLWRFSPAEYPWIGEDMSALHRDFLVPDLQVLLAAAAIEATVVVQARETLEETMWLLDCAEKSSIIKGVVGWAAIEDEGFMDALTAMDGVDRLVGLREVAQGQPDGFLDRERFNRGIGQLKQLDLAYDLLIHEGQLVEAARFVDRHPTQRFVLDHAAKPKIAYCELEPWGTNLRELGRRQNVVCKISGLVTEARWDDWTLDSLRPYLDVCVEVFGPNRLMAGSDWPVCLVATGYHQWFRLLEEYFRNFSDDEVCRIFGETAIDFYRLSQNAEVSS